MSRVHEIVFPHRASRTLLLTDLCFNIHEAKGPLTSTVYRMFGTWRRLASSRAYRWFTKDREAATQALRSVMAWDFDRVLLSHGDAIETGGHQAIRGALAWALGPPEGDGQT